MKAKYAHPPVDTTVWMRLTDLETRHGIDRHTARRLARERGLPIERHASGILYVRRADLPAWRDAAGTATYLPKPKDEGVVGRAVLGAVAALTGHPVEEIRGTGRRVAIIYPRRLAVGALRARGMTTAAIGRAVCRDHSTVAHALAYLAAHPAEFAADLDAVTGLLHDEDRTLAGADLATSLRRRLGDAGDAGRHAAAYALWLADGNRPVRWHERASALLGLRILASDPALRGLVEGAFAACGMAPLAARIALQARAAGMRWRAAS